MPPKSLTAPIAEIHPEHQIYLIGEHQILRPAHLLMLPDIMKVYLAQHRSIERIYINKKNGNYICFTDEDMLVSFAIDMGECQMYKNTGKKFPLHISNPLKSMKMNIGVKEEK